MGQKSTKLLPYSAIGAAIGVALLCFVLAPSVDLLGDSGESAMARFGLVLGALFGAFFGSIVADREDI